MAFEGLHEQPRTRFRVTEMFAFLSVDPNDGNEGVISMTLPNGVVMPLLAADKERLNELRPIAVAFGKSHGVVVRLVRLSGRKNLEVYMP